MRGGECKVFVLNSSSLSLPFSTIVQNEIYGKLDFPVSVTHYYTTLKDTTWVTLDATVPSEQLHLQIREHLADLSLPTRMDLY